VIQRGVNLKRCTVISSKKESFDFSVLQDEGFVELGKFTRELIWISGYVSVEVDVVEVNECEIISEYVESNFIFVLLLSDLEILDDELIEAFNDCDALL
jgi:hypothetical protein